MANKNCNDELLRIFLRLKLAHPQNLMIQNGEPIDQCDEISQTADNGMAKNKLGSKVTVASTTMPVCLTSIGTRRPQPATINNLVRLH